MRIVNLMENTNGNRAECLIEHGLSLYIESGKHKILVDTGASGAFAENAKLLGVDLSKVDIAVLSHGHYDHAGGLLAFAEHNSEALIYMRKNAGGDFYHVKPMKGEEKSGDGAVDEAKNSAANEAEKYIGIDKKILELAQVRLLETDAELDEELFLFGNVTGRKLWPQGNRELKRKMQFWELKQRGMAEENAGLSEKMECSGKEGSSDIQREFIQDDFSHEQYLVVREQGKQVLFSGCAHNGILNILEHYQKLFGGEPDAVFSGFHMRRKNGYGEDDLETIREIARELKNWKTKFYTGHCTGELPYQMMKEIMGEQLEYVHSGDEVTL